MPINICELKFPKAFLPHLTLPINYMHFSICYMIVNSFFILLQILSFPNISNTLTFIICCSECTYSFLESRKTSKYFNKTIVKRTFEN